ncbi:hypothetical protein [Tabrizicola sp.]|uniref:hypothetical protein n=1 Tax=Tabrizicola sp. TaxID=2005166 RepID=UPI003F312DF3
MKAVINIAVGMTAALVAIIVLGYFRYQSNLSDFAVGCERGNAEAGGPAGFCDCMMARFKSELGTVRGVVLSSAVLRSVAGMEESEIERYAADAALQCRA